MAVFSTKNYSRAFGTFPLKGDPLAAALNMAIDIGYRAIDTAQMYQNEADTGACLTASGVPREEFCITSKVPPANFDKAKFLLSVEHSIEALQIDYLDVLLLHWPPANGDIKPSLKLLEKAAKIGLTKHIGISNYTAQMMRDATSIVDAPLVTNQVEFHPLLNQDVLLAASKETGIPLSAYCTVARGEVFKHALFTDIGSRHNKSAAQVVLRWTLQNGLSVNTMSTRKENIKANYDIVDFTLTETEMTEINKLTHIGYRIVDKHKVPWAPEWD